MGNWAIHITGTGAYGNGKPEVDADLAAARLLEELLLQGHNIGVATFMAGGAWDLKNMVHQGSHVRCVVNGAQTEVLRISTYAQILAQAGGTQRHGPRPTITYFFPGKNTGGSLEPGHCLTVDEGTVFNVSDTSQA